MIHRILFLIILFQAFGFSQIPNPETILENVKKEFEIIDDYQVKVKVKVDIDFLKMPERQATIYYKKPDKIHIESDNFAMLPKTGLNFSPLGFMNYNYTSFYVREDTIDGILATVIKVIPLDGNAEVILSTFWIDTKRNVILRVESSRKPQGTFIVDFNYSKINGGYWLPSAMVFSFTIEPGLFPGRFLGDDDGDSDEMKKDSVDSKTGKVFLTYSEYKVNIGLPDELFEETEPNK